MKALIIGASGLVGGHLLSYLLREEKYTEVISVGRRKIDVEHNKLKQIVIDFEQGENYHSLPIVEYIFCCIGTTIKKAGSQEKFRFVDYDIPYSLAQWARQKEVKGFSIVSSLGANAESLAFYTRVKGEIERDLIALNFNNLSVFRPSLLLGDRVESRFGERVATVFMSVFNPFMIGALKKYRAIEAKDVAKAMYIQSLAEQRGVNIFLSDEIQRIADKS